ncbi:MAG: hypothetical protein FIA93_09505 [Deltaproteobacteria bacterium]|nr:hypothetical protein [Deltaproteobacteria bacterium]
MKSFKVGIFSVAVLLAMAGIGIGIAHAGGADWNVEALDSFYVDHELSQVANASSEDMQMESSIETGSLPSESQPDTSMVEAGGVTYRGEIDSGP